MSLPIALDFAPMEAESAEVLPVGEGWQYEPKWDGFRCLAHRDGDTVELRSKSGQPLGRYFPDVVAALSAVQASRFVLDGEILIHVDGIPSFEELQLRLHPAASRVRKLAAAHPAAFMAFDLLVTADGLDLTARTLRQRRGLLEEAFPALEGPSVLLSPVTFDPAEAAAWLDERGTGRDGVMAKRTDQTYRSGKRDGMVKVKPRRTADCVVGGFRYLKAQRQVGSLLLGLYDEAGLLDHIGFTSTIQRSQRASLTAELEKMVEPPGFTGKAPGGPSRWSTDRSADWQPVRPELVVEVAFDHVSGGRFRHGVTLLRFRPDKPPRQCDIAQMRR
ncbi:MAG: ATP-dependent DNA ligase [Acetobacteraceae bacterium]|nr:ATP-dependent DNA ligase [Acetobacteraceae bacterium]